MKSLQDFDALVQRIGTLPVAEQREHLLRYFSGVLTEMTPTQVTALRGHLLQTFPACPIQDLMIEVLDGHLSLIEIKGDAADSDVGVPTSMNLEPFTDRFGTIYQVEFNRDPLWTFKIWSGHREIGRIYCAGSPPVLELRDIRMCDDVVARETFWARTWRRLRRLPQPRLNYRNRGIGTAMLNRIEGLACSEGFRSIEGWISKVDTDRDPNLPTWYRRRGFEVQMLAEAGLKVATIRKGLTPSVRGHPLP